MALYVCEIISKIHSQQQTLSRSYTPVSVTSAEPNQPEFIGKDECIPPSYCGSKLKLEQYMLHVRIPVECTKDHFFLPCSAQSGSRYLSFSLPLPSRTRSSLTWSDAYSELPFLIRALVPGVLALRDFLFSRLPAA